MQEIFDHIYIGTVRDYEFLKDIYDFQKSWSFVGAAKHPFHVQHAKADGESQEGYKGVLHKGNKEYLIAERNHAIYCNLIDTADPKYISETIMERCISFLEEELALGRNVLICCNKAESRSPSIAFLYLFKHYRGKHTYQEMLAWFHRIYPPYRPGNGMKQFVESYCKKLENEHEAV